MAGGVLCPFAIRIAATCVETFYLEQMFEYFAPFFSMKRSRFVLVLQDAKV